VFGRKVYLDIRNFPSDPLSPRHRAATFVHQTICPQAATSARSVLIQRTRKGGLIFINTELDKYIPLAYEVALFQLNCMPMWPSYILSNRESYRRQRQEDVKIGGETRRIESAWKI
jgi:hypothetical protein